ncbi:MULTISPECIES: iron ABC transporter permease [Rhodococcus]|uniref:Iron ABC transporter permease n=1 Tax=Rhodococcus oxybenzonivorans TaxID=1990687 RepID=A0AAE4V2N2_9NOCA|nr:MULTISPECIES: iron ABC transporter permease [Rhodococcus]MDV7242430.1 iron ABC transporter permease [Rhodococcus oxybenzonivorans]MDV7266684.1 iron ABC transporter permease [Rhodococcus oxybenzonivorans]MDV7277177.1 iron ABC transporter permease [Rhodococcus oxybenzonivorans]MDV7331919.1 iron ABC transporter permease [Rhodococcus oxybenzonivorans]MDV7344140.1 iron ABC transporter permease [Rhodococcus oxybenzonivorans]
MTTTRQFGSDLPHLPTDEEYGKRDIPRGPAPLPLRALAGFLDAVVVAIPLVLGWYLVDALSDSNGGGQADRVVFGGATVAIAVGLAVWNKGFREGNTGQSSGKGWVGLVTRDATSLGAIGPKRSLRRLVQRSGTEVVRDRTADDEGFVAREKDGSVAAIRRRRLIGLGVLVVLLGVVLLASIAVGARPLSFTEIFSALFDADGSQADIIVRTLRGPRTILGLVVGMALGVAGALIQGHTRNPLADAGLLGLNAGAAFLVVLSMYLFGFSAPSEYLWFAFAGSFLASVVVFGLSSIGNGAASPLSLALAGAAVAFFLQAMTNAIIIVDQASLDSYRFWVVGSVAGRGFDVLWQVLPFLVIGLLLALASTPGLNVLSLGEDVARSLGTNIGASRALGIVAITLLTGAATAACGPIAFIGLVVPHVARAITGPDYRWLVPYAGLLGGVMLVTADVIGRVVVRPGELQVGIVLAVFGAPFFIALVRRRKLASL